MKKSTKKPTILIKKYPNRRLYNTKSSSYITLDDLQKMVQEDVDFVVVDAKTEEDLTKLTLTQIILEQEIKGNNLLPLSFLRSIICFYGHNVKSLIPPYLEGVMETFMKQLETSEASTDAYTVMQEWTKQSMEIFEQNMALFEELTTLREKETTTPDK